MACSAHAFEKSLGHSVPGCSVPTAKIEDGALGSYSRERLRIRAEFRHEPVEENRPIVVRNSSSLFFHVLDELLPSGSVHGIVGIVIDTMARRAAIEYDLPHRPPGQFHYWPISAPSVLRCHWHYGNGHDDRKHQPHCRFSKFPFHRKSLQPALEVLG